MCWTSLIANSLKQTSLQELVFCTFTGFSEIGIDLKLLSHISEQVVSLENIRLNQVSNVKCFGSINWFCSFFFFSSAKFQLAGSQLCQAATAETAFPGNHWPPKLKTSNFQTFDQSDETWPAKRQRQRQRHSQSTEKTAFISNNLK